MENTKIPDNELMIVWEICVKQNWYTVHTWTKLQLNYDVVKDIFEKWDTDFDNIDDFIQDLISKQLTPVLAQFTLKDPFIEVYAEIKDENTNN